MAQQFEPPPTYAEPVIVDEVTGKSRFNPIWLKWFLNAAAAFGVVPNHEQLNGLLGSTPNQHFHVSELTAEKLAIGIDAFVPLAKITGGGTDGSLTFEQGVLVARVDPT